MSRRTEKRKYGKYNKFDVVYADFGKNPHGIQGGIRPGIIISCDASNHDGAPQVSVVPLSSKFRHTFASRFCENETNIKVIQEVMGHADVSTTMNIYAEANPDVTKSVIEKLSKNMDIF